MSKGEQRVPVRVDSALGRTLGQGSEPQGVRAPKTQRTRSGWMRDVLDRRPLEVDPDPGVDPHKQKGLPESPPGEPQRGNERKSHSLSIPRGVFGNSATHPGLSECSVCDGVCTCVGVCVYAYV